MGFFGSEYERVVRGLLMVVVFLMVAIPACVLTLGCGTSGRVAVIEWDSRDAEQIMASAEETRAFYVEQEDTPKADEKAVGEKSFSAWAELFELLAKLRVRVSAVRVEWRAAKGG